MRFLGKRPVLFQSGQWHFHQDNAPVHVSIFVTEYLTKMGIKTVPQPPNSPDVAPCDFWLFPKLRVNHYETIEEMKDVLTKVIDKVTQEDVHGAFQKLLERYKCIAAGGVYFEWDLSFIWVLSTKVPIRKKSGNLFDDPRIYMCIMVKILRKNHFQTTKFYSAAYTAMHKIIMIYCLWPKISFLYLRSSDVKMIREFMPFIELCKYSHTYTHTHTHMYIYIYKYIYIYIWSGFQCKGMRKRCLFSISFNGNHFYKMYLFLHAKKGFIYGMALYLSKIQRVITILYVSG